MRLLAGASALGGWSGPMAEVGQDRRHAAVFVGGVAQVQLQEDLGDVSFQRLGCDEELPGDRLVGAAFGDQREYLELARREVLHVAESRDALAERRIDHGLAGVDAL